MKSKWIIFGVIVLILFVVVSQGLRKEKPEIFQKLPGPDPGSKILSAAESESQAEWTMEEQFIDEHPVEERKKSRRR